MLDQRARETSLYNRCMSGELVCVFGISGVGKTTLIKLYVATHGTWHRLQASDLLARHAQAEPDQLRIAPRPVIEENQYLLANLIGAQRALAAALQGSIGVRARQSRSGGEKSELHASSG
jgi:ABC-type lipoprotein export system ATPase subunit